MIKYAEEVHGVLAIPLLDSPACESFIDYARRLGRWENAEVQEQITEGVYETVVMPDVRSAAILRSADEPEVFQQFDERMDSIIKPLIKQVWQVDLTEHSATQLIRYQPGGHYQGHPDAGGDLGYRYFSVVCYLNDDFEGGKTRFPSLNYSASPECGKAILFPAKYFHCAQPVVSGEKFVLVSWVVGPVPIKWI
jgi:Rps23 Pro-64 3,4-dihydroxylase Tpa1-like proline 4-hydroxylase